MTLKGPSSFRPEDREARDADNRRIETEARLEVLLAEVARLQEVLDEVRANIAYSSNTQLQTIDLVVASIKK